VIICFKGGVDEVEEKEGDILRGARKRTKWRIFIHDREEKMKRGVEVVELKCKY
jgi:hypothetical protein